MRLTLVGHATVLIELDGFAFSPIRCFATVPAFFVRGLPPTIRPQFVVSTPH
jgi:hypothetical protein